ncbi:MAG: ABC transporter ATP-binding protein [Clostridia bacterium]|nr:ABC transporter ATP-binding protein [Deltaproteobacteria bacterium]
MYQSQTQTHYKVAIADDDPRDVQVEPRLGVRNIKCKLGGRLILDDVTFAVQPGEIVGLLGPNGSGKSTLLRAITGLTAWSHGTLWLDGRVVEPNATAFRSRLGVVFQDPSLDPHLTARENLILGARLFALSKAESTMRADALLAFMELSDRAADRVKTFSGGMRRRLELARAMIHRPAMLVLDEPTTGLDPHAFERTWRLLLALKRDQGLTGLVSTHGAEEAAKCDRLVVLDGGKVVAFDTPAALLARVSGDVLTITSRSASDVARDLLDAFGVAASVKGDTLTITTAEAHTLVPRIVELFPRGTIETIAVSRPTLADAFLKLTGRKLEDEPVVDDQPKLQPNVRAHP